MGHQDGPCGSPISGQSGRGRPRGGLGLQSLGRWTGLPAGRRPPVYARPTTFRKGGAIRPSRRSSSSPRSLVQQAQRLERSPFGRWWPIPSTARTAALPRVSRTHGSATCLALEPSHSWWHPVDAVGAFGKRRNRRDGGMPCIRGEWQCVERHFQDGHVETWWALEVVAGPDGPAKPRRAVVATTDPATLPDLSTWYLRTNLPVAAASDADEQTLPAADLAEIVRLYGLRNWVEQSYKQVKLPSVGASIRSAPIWPSGVIGRWSAVPSVPVGRWPRRSSRPANPPPRMSMQNPMHLTEPTTRRTGGGKIRPRLTWPQSLRQVRAWLTPWIWLQRWWQAWSPLPPPPELQALIDALAQGHPLAFYDSS